MAAHTHNCGYCGRRTRNVCWGGTWCPDNLLGKHRCDPCKLELRLYHLRRLVAKTQETQT